LAGVSAVLHAGGSLIRAKQKGHSMFKEFRDFALKGNMIDLAIGVIIGAAFGAIVSSLVDDVFMPIIGLIIGGIDFSNLFIVLNNPNNAPVPSLAAARALGVSTLNIGLFINAIVKFSIIAFVLFMVVKGLNSLKKKDLPQPAADPVLTKEESLLAEIRDLLKAQGAPRSALLIEPVPVVAAAVTPVAKPVAAKAPATKPAVAKPAAEKKPAARKPAPKKPTT
jgi:large conductance mechanosensitive channel